MKKIFKLYNDYVIKYMNENGADLISNYINSFITWLLLPIKSNQKNVEDIKKKTNSASIEECKKKLFNILYDYETKIYEAGLVNKTRKHTTIKND